MAKLIKLWRCAFCNKEGTGKTPKVCPRCETSKRLTTRTLRAE